MKVILKKKVKGLGNLGSIVEVKDGFARNYLFPRELAIAHSKEGLKVIEVEKKKTEGLIKKRKQDALDLAEKLKSISCTVKVKAGEEDKLFGSVTTADIAQALKSEGIDIDKKDILLEENIKSLGVYQVFIKLHPEVKGEVRVWVVNATTIEF